MRIGFLGLGVMGGYMAANLAQQGYTVKAWNRTPNRPGIEIAASGGAEIVSSLQAAVESAEIVCTCVGDVPDVEAVILAETGVVQWAQPGTIVIDFSTIGPQAARQIGTELESRQLKFLDAPISGGDIGAQNGTLTIMVGGDETVFKNCQPLLTAMGKTIRYCGESGSGQAVKLCNQVLAALNMVGVCEAMLLAKQQGIDPNLVVEVCSTGAAGSWALANLGTKVATADYAPGFMIKHILKDLRLVQESLPAESDFPGIELADRLFKVVQGLEAGSIQGTQAMIRAYQNE